MRVAKKKSEGILEGDLTPMIDMTFQLIAFFMVLINFSQAEQNEKIQLPDSQLAKPPEGPLEFPITIHLTTDSTAIIGASEVPIAAARVLSCQGKAGACQPRKGYERSDDHHPRAQGCPDGAGARTDTKVSGERL